MDIFEAVQKRRSIRAFQSKPVPREALERMVDAARLAPTGYNRQPWEFIVLDTCEDIEWFQGRGSMGWLAQAPALVLFVLDPSTPFWREDGSAAIANFQLAATALGYGTCWVQGQIEPYEDVIKERYGLAPDRRILAIVPVGTADMWPEAKNKKTLDEVLVFHAKPAE